MRKKIITHVGIIITGIVILFFPVQSGILLSDQTGAPYHFFCWEDNKVTIGWKHSVELTPWEETYQMNEEGELSFVSTFYKSYGAGTPDTEGNVEFLSNDWIRVTDIERKIPYYSLFYVSTSNYYIRNDSDIFPLANYVPDDTEVQIRYKKLKIYECLLLNIHFIKGRDVR